MVVRIPLGLRLVECWLVLLSLVTLEPTLRLLTGYQGPLASPPSYVTLVYGVYIAFLVYALVGLFQLRRVPVGLCLVLLVWWMLPLILRLAWRMSTDPPRPRVLAVVAVLLGLNGWAMWYLARPTFWTFRAQFRKEKDAESLRKLIEKRIRSSAR